MKLKVIAASSDKDRVLLEAAADFVGLTGTIEGEVETVRRYTMGVTYVSLRLTEKPETTAKTTAEVPSEPTSPVEQTQTTACESKTTRKHKEKTHVHS